MLSRENFTKEHIESLQKKDHRDPVLLERTVFAFGLLEALVRVGMPFIFKGGTCLMLLLERPRRLSTDIDIMVEPGTDLEKYLEAAAEIFPFTAVEEQVRIGKNHIEKRHFKFSYGSNLKGGPRHIILDVLFEHNHYTELVTKPIVNELLIIEQDEQMVQLPSVNCMLGDKMTAFAPHTIGIPFDGKKNMDVMKQFYDIAVLLDECTDFSHVQTTYRQIAAAEIAYRDLDIQPKDALHDTFDSALCVASRGKVNGVEYPTYVDAIKKLRAHIFTENYTAERAVYDAAKVMYAVACLMTESAYTKVTDPEEYLDKALELETLKSLKYLRHAHALAYAYVVKTDVLLSVYQKEISQID